MATGRRGDRPSRSPLEEELLGALQSPYDGGGEAGAVGTVGDAVVERERERQQDAGGDAAGQHNRLRPRARGGGEGDLRVIDGRAGRPRAERPGGGQREG